MDKQSSAIEHPSICQNQQSSECQLQIIVDAALSLDSSNSVINETKSNGYSNDMLIGSVILFIIFMLVIRTNARHS